MKLHHLYFHFPEVRRPVGFNVSHYKEVSIFDDRFRRILHKHLTVLVWWSTLNIVSSFIALLTMKGSTYYFWMMSGVWGLINFTIAIGFFYHTLYEKPGKGSSNKRLQVQSHVQRMMCLHIGIDAAYVFTGFCLRANSFVCDEKYQDLWLGFGWAIVVQGLILLLLDITLFSLYRSNFLKAQPFWRNHCPGSDCCIHHPPGAGTF